LVKILIICGVILAATLLLVFIWPQKPEAEESPAKK